MVNNTPLHGTPSIETIIQSKYDQQIHAFNYCDLDFDHLTIDYQRNHVFGRHAQIDMIAKNI